MEKEEISYPDKEVDIVAPNHNNLEFYILLVFSFVAVAIAIGLPTYLTFDSHRTYYLVRLLQFVSFTLLGILIIRMLKKKIGNFSFRILKVSLMISVFIFLALLFLSLFFNVILFLFPLGLSCAFLLPTVIYTADDVIKDNKNILKIWKNFGGELDNTVSINLNSIAITIKLTLISTDHDAKIFDTMIPGHVAFGHFFNKFLTDLKKTQEIDLADENGIWYGWFFEVQDKTGNFKKYLDPDLNLSDNEVKEFATISAKRIIIESERLLTLSTP
jgi:hypothetical protein